MSKGTPLIRIIDGPSYYMIGGVISHAVHYKNGEIHGRMIMRVSDKYAYISTMNEGEEVSLRLIEASSIVPFKCKDDKHTDCEFN